MKFKAEWKVVFGTAFFIGLVFIWGNEVLDFPHYLIGAPKTPINWQESIIETVFSTIFAVIAYLYIREYERRWRESLSKLERLAFLDDLTGILNRGEFMKRANQEFSRSNRSGIPFVLIMLDFDNFKLVNDHHGHLTGDKVLREFTAVMTRYIRHHDIAGRLGGDEFGIVLTDASRDGALAISRRIMDEWKKVEIFNEEGKPVIMSVSMGITSWNVKDAALTDMISRADKLLYQAKESGKNRVEVE